jgi:hypothetical protein
MQSFHLAISAVLLSAACATGRPAATVEAWPHAGSEPFLAAAEPATEEPAEPTAPSRLHSGRVLVGGTTDRGGGGFTLGGQYEYRLKADWGVGGFADVTFGSDVAIVIGAAGYWHPIDRLTLLAGPGVDLEADDIFVRVGGSYDFTVKDYVIGPALYIDLGAKGTPILLGLSISLDF